MASIARENNKINDLHHIVKNFFHKQWSTSKVFSGNIIWKIITNTKETR